MTPVLFAWLAGLSCLLSLLLYLPPRAYGALQLPYFMLTFMWGELALYNILFQALNLLGWLALGALEWLRPFVLRIQRCEKQADIPYGEEFPEQCLDLYLPEEGKGPYPVLLYIHGGAFFMGDKAQQGRLLYQHGVDAGWAVASINYRLGPDHRMPAMIIDTKRAVSWLRDRAGEYGLDTHMIVSAIDPNTTHAFDQTRSSRSIPTMQALLHFMNWVRGSSPAQGAT